jgi:hypothetical protein
MRAKISPVVFVSVLAFALLIFGVFAWNIWKSPSSVPTTVAEQKNAINPRAGGGPDADALKYRDEYNKTHSGSAGKR